MSSIELLISAIYYSLFHTKLFNNEYKIINNLPQNAFGIFCTIRRYNTIKTYPQDIHGCIGYWDNNFNSLNRQILYSNLLRVSYDAVWNDNRKTYFPPIETDPETVMELDFMMNPIYNINKDTGFITELNTTFTNKTFGIIIQTKDKSQKATYLPHVFNNISWINIVKSIKNKANITDDNYDLFAYKIIQIKSKLIDILIDELFSYQCIFKFSRLLIDNMKLDLDFPFPYSCNNNVLQWDKNDDVRNISALGEIYSYIKLYPNIANRTETQHIKYKILNILENIDQYSSQAFSFLGYTYPIFKVDSTKFCTKLLKDFPSAENEFEKPEITIGLNKAGCTYNIDNYLLTYNTDDSIFKMNWIIQTIVSFHKKPSRDLIIILENKTAELLQNKNNTETNYLAVAFEALCYVYSTTGKLNTLKLIFKLLFELEQRKNCNNTLYAFLDKAARVDITCHILNGFVALRKYFTNAGIKNTSVKNNGIKNKQTKKRK